MLGNGLVDVGLGVLSHALTTGAGGYAGYLFARRQTEHEIGYGRRVETVERLQSLLVSVGEEFEEALASSALAPSALGPAEPSDADDGQAAEKLRWLVEDLERYALRQAIWLDPGTFAILEALADELHGRLRDLDEALRMGGPRRERELAELEAWVHGELPRAREELAAEFRRMLGAGRWSRGPRLV